jgi:hypothetical protein
LWAVRGAARASAAALEHMTNDPFVKWCRNPPAGVSTETAVSCVGPALATWGHETRVSAMPWAIGISTATLVALVMSWLLVKRGSGARVTQQRPDELANFDR